MRFPFRALPALPAVVALSLAAVPSATAVRAGASPPPEGAELVSPDSLINAVHWLADDAREGRMTGEPGGEAAAHWIADRMKAYGLEPAGDDGTYFQNLEATVGVGFGDENTLSLNGLEEMEEIQHLALNEDYVPFAFSESGTVDAPLVFAGYGITAPEYDYDDYQGIDVKGKAVLVLRHEPQVNDTTSVFNGSSHTPHAAFRDKARNAKEHGAVAILIFTGPESAEYEQDKLMKPEWGQAIGGSDILAAHVSKEIGEALLTHTGTDVRDWVHEVDADLKPRSFEFGPDVSVHLVVSMNKDRKATENVVGKLPGTDPGAGALILGAHYDHLGFGNSSSMAPDRIGEIHNGADDNASGTSAVLELARVFASQPRLRRTLYFAAFTGEELGLIGSSYMAIHPPVPLETVQAMLNLDMVGRPRDHKLTIGGVGTSPAFDAAIKAADEASPLELVESKGGFGASDHTMFYVKDVPVLFFFSGLHEDYHKPSDDWQKIDREGITDATRVVYDIAVDLAQRDDRVTFAKADEDDHPHSGTGGGGYGPYLGTIPDFGEQEHGVKLAGVRDGSPADKAGIRGGDVVVRFDHREINDLYDYTEALRAHQPGDTVEIVVLRDGAEVTLQATLGTRE